MTGRRADGTMRAMVPSPTQAVKISRRLILALSLFVLLLAACGRESPNLTPTAGVSPAAPPDITAASSITLRAPTAPAPPPAPDYWPTRDWRTSTPAAQGLDAGRLAQMLDEVKRQNLPLHSLLIIRNGYIVSENYFAGYGPDTTHELYSCTKSFISTLVGIALDRGYLDRLDRPVKDFFPKRAWANPDPRKDAMTVENLLTMTSGLAWTEGDPTYRQMYSSRDWVQFVMDTPVRESPGSAFNYCSGCSHLLSAILQQTTGRSTLDFAAQELFGPLGISNYEWHADAQGLVIGGWGLQMTPREMAKLGYLYLHRGVWEGKQILSSDWVQAATARHVGTDGPFGYGYQWWTYPALGAYTARGRFGQLIFVIPNLDLVVVSTANVDDDGQVLQLIEKFIAPAATHSD